jgi:uncharacterized protein with PhoU and TrkA domain
MVACDIEAELKSLARYQTMLVELEIVLKGIGTRRGWSSTRIAGAVLGMEGRINAVERRVQMLLIEAAKDDDL